MSSPETPAGRLRRLRTKDEVENHLKVTDAWVLEAPRRAAGDLLRCVHSPVMVVRSLREGSHSFVLDQILRVMIKQDAVFLNPTRC